MHLYFWKIPKLKATNNDLNLSQLCCVVVNSLSPHHIIGQKLSPTWSQATKSVEQNSKREVFYIYFTRTYPNIFHLNRIDFRLFFSSIFICFYFDLFYLMCVCIAVKTRKRNETLERMKQVSSKHELVCL